MALTAGMLNKLRSLITDRDEKLLKINLAEGDYVYGYLREVGSDYFAIDEVQTHRSSGNIGEWPQTKFRVTTKKVGLKTVRLDLVDSWVELPPGASVPYTGG